MKSSPPAFGRASPQNRPPLPAKRRGPAPQPDQTKAGEDVADDLAAWEKARQRPPFPWRPFFLVTSLCFGVASLVLPEQVNDAVTYILYAIAGISFFGGLAGRRKNPS